MLKVRFFKTGRKKQPFYKIVVTHKNNPPAGGRFVDEIGFYNPLTKEFKINEERLSVWTKKGARLSETLHNLLIKKGIIEGKKKNVVSLSRKRREKMESQKKEEKPEESIKEEVKEEQKKEEASVKEEEVEKDSATKEEDVSDNKEPVKEEVKEEQKKEESSVKEEAKEGKKEREKKE